MRVGVHENRTLRICCTVNCKEVTNLAKRESTLLLLSRGALLIPSLLLQLSPKQRPTTYHESVNFVKVKALQPYDHADKLLLTVDGDYAKVTHLALIFEMIWIVGYRKFV